MSEYIHTYYTTGVAIYGRLHGRRRGDVTLSAEHLDCVDEVVPAMTSAMRYYDEANRFDRAPNVYSL